MQRARIARHRRTGGAAGPHRHRARRSARPSWSGSSREASSSLLDLPAPSAIGFFAGVASLFPHVGLTLGAIPMLLLTLGFRSLFAAIVLLVVTLVAAGRRLAW